MILYQVGALKAFLDAEGVPLNHIKPHGELFFYMQRDETTMRAVLKACKTFNVPVYACRNPVQQVISKELDVVFQEEAYVDIDYSKEGKLIPVAKSQTVNGDIIYDRITSIGMTGKRTDADGNELDLGFKDKPFSICLHSDMPTALANVIAGRKAVDEVNTKRFPKVNGAA